jgi:hypothetical protein
MNLRRACAFGSAVLAPLHHARRADFGRRMKSLLDRGGYSWESLPIRWIMARRCAAVIHAFIYIKNGPRQAAPTITTAGGTRRETSALIAAPPIAN